MFFLDFNQQDWPFPNDAAFSSAQNRYLMSLNIDLDEADVL